ncbi:hypothetical protein FQA47_011655 [Oryzias melastigma]|uniref:Uncharacterized protein n=1 Tax=Oryzias melastigma TaxID=30732 RepID=A0A834F6Z2_ORYME|nr:hypothetical protein FQA47_011655 [Oryzias melastigma]
MVHVGYAGLFVSSGSSAHGAHSGAPPPPLRQARSHRQQHNTTSALAASASHSQQEQEHIFIRASIPQLHTVVCARPTPGRRVFILPLFKIYFYYRREEEKSRDEGSHLSISSLSWRSAASLEWRPNSSNSIDSFPLRTLNSPFYVHPHPSARDSETLRPSGSPPRQKPL